MSEMKDKKIHHSLKSKGCLHNFMLDLQLIAQFLRLKNHLVFKMSETKTRSQRSLRIHKEFLIRLKFLPV